MADLSIIILTFNEERHIERAIRSLGPVTAKIFVVDSFSTDRTCDIARSLGAEVVQHAFSNQSQQMRWALDNLPIETEWVMRLDADEALTPKLAAEIAERLDDLPIGITGVRLRRRYIFMGRWIRHGGRYPLIQLRIWRKGKGTVERRWMDEHMVLLKGVARTFKHDFVDDNIGDLTSFIRKHNSYATREAIEVLCNKYEISSAGHDRLSKASDIRVTATRYIKIMIYNKLPMWLGPAGYYFYRYILRLGFLDGHEGMIYHFLQAFWYRFLVSVKVEEFDQVLRALPDAASRSAELARLSGYTVADIVFSKSDEPKMALGKGN